MQNPAGIAVAFLGAWIAFCIVAPPLSASQRPNVIVVMTDDQGYGEFGIHGNPIARTPHIDALARQSVRLTDFHVAPMCTPTRGQFMTGLDAFRNAATNVSSGRTLLRADLPTIADVFSAAGYRTGLFGKWHLGDNYPYRPHDRGFDEALWFASSHVNSVPDHWDNDYFDDVYLRNGQKEQVSGYCTDVWFDEAQKWIARSDQPFFAVIATNAAHWPWFVPDRYREGIRVAMRQRPEVTAHLDDDQRQSLISFLAMGANIDDNIGRMDRYLKDRGLWDDTIVVFLTDNGSTFGPDYFNAGMTGKKTTLWEGGHRVPCFVRWPSGGLQVGPLHDLAHVQDLLPTLADLASIRELPEASDGISLAQRLRGQGQPTDRMLVINYSRMPGMEVGYSDRPEVPARRGAAVLWGQWRLLEDERLYDVRSDPSQQHDVAATHPEVLAKMRSHLNAWWDRVKDSVNDVQRVTIGSDHENPSLLTACEWLDVFVDQQIQVRRGQRRNGVWHVHVDRPGRYRLAASRWPTESGLKLRDAIDQTPVVDGRYVAGPSWPIRSVAFRVGDVRSVIDVEGQAVTADVEVDLVAGPTEIEVTMIDDDGQPLGGPYYLYVTRQ